MEFLDKLTKKASETYKGAAEKTGKIAKEAKLKMKINENKSKINNLYEEIGKKVYQKHIAEEINNIKDEIQEECEKIDILSAEIDSYHDEILNLSDIKTCVNCKETINKEYKFCPKCGTEQPEENNEEAKEVEVLEQEETNIQNETETMEEYKVSEESKKDEEIKENVEPEKVEYTEGEENKTSND